MKELTRRARREEGGRWESMKVRRFESVKVRKWEPEAKPEMGRESDQLIPEAEGRRQREALAEGNVSRRCLRWKVGKWEGLKV
jgi:hypothetical protein